MKPTSIYVSLALVAVLAMAGCGSSNKSSSTASSTPTQSTPSTTSSTPSSSGGGGSSSVQLSADPSGALKFDKSSATAKAGKVTITMDNPSPIPHGVAIQGGGANKVGNVVNKGGKSTVTATLKAGKYAFYCPVPGHRQAGMQGTLTVQ
jgi:uncharacterized cupredoxin-like copper-binding protein